jgi:hypothetical protein
MPRITIQQFRARLAGRAEQDTSTHVYLEIAQRPDLTREMGPRDWSPWPQLAAPRMAA